METPTISGLSRTPRVTAGKLLAAVRAFSLPVSVLPVAIATAAALPPAQWRWDVLVISLLGVALLSSAGNLLNDYFDYRSKVDRRTHGDESRPGRLLVRGELLPGDVLIEALVCLVLAMGCAGYLTWRCGPVPLWFTLAAVAGLYAYTGPPFKLKYRALGEPLIFVVFGPLLMTAAAWVQVGHFVLPALLLSLPIGLATTAILVGNNFRDRQEDREAGIRTIGHFAGGQVARVGYVVLVCASVAGLAALAAAGAAPRALLGAPAAFLLLRRPLSCMWRGRRLADIDARTARFEAVLLLGVLAAYLIQLAPR